MLNTISELARSRWYWLFMFVFCLGIESTALFYQYALDYAPCVVCIHVRLWFALVILLALVGCFSQHWKLSVLLQLLVSAVMLALAERSYVLLSTERGWAFGSCDFDLGLPAWLAVEDWWPTVFKVWEPCGYTPELLFGITMAEALIVISVLLAGFSAILTVAAFVSGRRETV